MIKFVKRLIHNLKTYYEWKRYPNEWKNCMIQRVNMMKKNGMSLKTISEYLHLQGDKFQNSVLIRDRKTGYLYIKRGA